jgi:hypothetical protein
MDLSSEEIPPVPPLTTRLVEAYPSRTSYQRLIGRSNKDSATTMQREETPRNMVGVYAT